jgi:tetratricopeptide (TPR) repeat protein
MLEAEEERDPLEVLAAEFIERQRRGECPSIAEYKARYPALAADIEDLFPTIAVMEQVKAHKEQGSGTHVSLGAIRLERLGDFRILGEIGRGGMGIVYEAFQESLGRHVAVKVLPGHALLDPRHLRRFQREAQTAARLHHTNIVPVFGVGEHDGFHYIVMQLIDGAGLDDVLANLRQDQSRMAMAAGNEASRLEKQEAPSPLRAKNKTDVSRLARAFAQGQFGQPRDFDNSGSGSSGDLGQTREAVATSGQSPPPAVATEEFAFKGETKVNGNHQTSGSIAAVRSELSETWQFGPPYWRSVATIGQQVADALHYAHSHHTLHRDIKPANLLLDSQGVAWITDFGLAKAMEQDNVTQTGAMVGTLRYMAPEQFAGRADAQSDVYSLGLTLYELLTLRPAFEANSRSSLIAKIAHGEPPRPRKFNPAIPRDLETIVLKAMAREPRDRYPTAGDLARDLACFLEDRPIQARRASAAERLWRWARRNRAVASLLVCTLVLLVIVAVVTSVGYLRTSQANAQEKIQRKKAEETSALAVGALDKIFRQFAPDRAAPASASLRVSDTEDPIAVPVQPVLSKEAATLLEHLLKFYDQLAKQAGDDPRMLRKVAQANGRVGDIRQSLGQYAESKEAYLHAIDLYAPLAKSSTSARDLQFEIARIQNELGSVYDKMNDLEDGHKSHLDALATLQATSADSATSPELQYELARTYYFLGRRPDGLSGLRPPGLGGPRGPWGGPPSFIFDPGGPRHGPLAPFPLSPPQAGEESLDKALALWQSLVINDSPWPRRGQDMRHQRQLGKSPGGPDSPRPFPDDKRRESDRYRHEAIDLLERLVADYPTVPAYRHFLARCYRELSQPWGRPGASSDRDNLNKAIEILEKLVKENPDIADYRYDLSETYAMLGDTESPRSDSQGNSAESRSPATLEKALAVAEHPNIPDYDVSLVNTCLRLSNSLWESDPTRAEANLRKARDVQLMLVHRFPDDSSYKFWLATIQEALGRLLMKQPDHLREAQTALQECIDSFSELLENHKHFNEGLIRSRILPDNYWRLAVVFRGLNEDKKAEEALHQASLLRQQP